MKRSKHFADKDASAPKTSKASIASAANKRKSPAQPAATKSTKASPAKRAAQKSSSKSKRAIVLDSDAEDEDGDFQASLATAYRLWHLISSQVQEQYEKPKRAMLRSMTMYCSPYLLSAVATHRQHMPFAC